MASQGVSRIDPEGSLEKRQKNHDQSTQILRLRGFELEPKNFFIHYIVRKNGVVADFWPTTGQYKIRSENTAYRRGVFNMIRDMERLKNDP